MNNNLQDRLRGDTAGAVAGAQAGAAYGLDAIPEAWRAALHGEWPLRSGVRWDAARLAALADRLAAEGGGGRRRDPSLRSERPCTSLPFDSHPR